MKTIGFIFLKIMIMFAMNYCTRRSRTTCVYTCTSIWFEILYAIKTFLIGNTNVIWYNVFCLIFGTKVYLRRVNFYNMVSLFKKKWSFIEYDLANSRCLWLNSNKAKKWNHNFKISYIITYRFVKLHLTNWFFMLVRFFFAVFF